MAAILQGNALYLSGYVGGDWFDEDKFSTVDIILALSSFDRSRRLTVHINSGGGIASEGSAMFAMLDALPGGCDVIIDGIAASAASLIAMAGDTVLMSPGSIMMIHDPAGSTFGNSADHGKTIEALEAMSAAYAAIYARKTGRSPAECREIMKEETWLDPNEAIALGFADAVTPSGKAALVAAFDYSTFLRAPQRLVALACKNKWTASTKPSASNQPGKDGKMPIDNQVHAAAKARIKAIMKADEADGRGKLAEHLAYETELTPEAAVAVMSAAPQEQDTNDGWVPPSMRRRLRTDGKMNAEGLNNQPAGKSVRESRLVSSMKQRHGAK